MSTPYLSRHHYPRPLLSSPLLQGPVPFSPPEGAPLHPYVILREAERSEADRRICRTASPGAGFFAFTPFRLQNDRKGRTGFRMTRRASSGFRMTGRGGSADSLVALGRWEPRSCLIHQAGLPRRWGNHRHKWAPFTLRQACPERSRRAQGERLTPGTRLPPSHTYGKVRRRYRSQPPSP